ncbi:MAG: GDSL family lipase [Lachnospiraceae bacterium]|nr:GDSL family lipase [Lachnospiraceae bacterium]
MLREIRIADEEKILVHGRTLPDRDPAVLLWNGSSVEFNVRATELWVELAGPFDVKECWIAIELNGAVIARQMLKPERDWICIFRGKEVQDVSRVRIIKEQQAMNFEASHRIEVWAVKTDGEILPPPVYDHRIEFVGDSINSGEGSIGAREETQWISTFFSHIHAYPYMVAKALNADYRIVSQGGWGVYISWDRNLEAAIPRVYEGICSVAVPDFAVPGLHEKNDFAAWQPEVIVVNLGTNDNTGTHPEGREADPEELKKIQEAVCAFLHTLRKNNPQAYIIWAFGILGDQPAPLIKAGIEDFKKQSGDERVEYLPIPNTTEETVGSLGHPGEEAHRQAAEVITKRLREIL